MTGCSGSSDQPELGYVTGTITLDGQPLAGVIVVFKPEEGRAATGQTDAEGEYELEYLYKTAGCKVGPNTISLEWPLGEGGRAIPAKYTAGRSILKEDVKAGNNTIDLVLDSSGADGAAAPAGVVD